MSINLLDMVKGAVSKQVMGQIGGVLGQSDQNKTSGMFDTATQSILGGLIKKASTPEGAREVFKTVQDQDDGILDKLGDILGGGAQQQEHFQKQGGGILDMVFGNNRGGIMGIIGKFMGLDGSIMGKLMSMAAPIVLGVIGKHIKSKALDAVGLGNFLGQQKSHLGGAMPSALTSQLGFGNLLGNVTGAGKAAVGSVGDAASGAAGVVGNAASGAAGAAGNAGRAAANAASGAAGAVGNAASGAAGAAGDAGRAAANAANDAASGIGGLLKLLLPLILIGGAIYFAYPFIAGTVNKVGDAAGDAASGAAGAVGGAVGAVGDAAGGVAGAVGDAASGAVGAVGDAAGGVAGSVGDAASGAAGAVGGAMGKMTGGFKMPEMPAGLDLGGFDMNGLTGQMSGITDGFKNVTDAAGAQNLAGKLTDFTGNLDNMGIGNLPEASKGFMGKMFGGFTGTIENAMSGFQGNDSVMGILKPAVDTLTDKIKGFGF